MGKSYTPAPAEVHKIISDLITEWHPDLDKAGVKVEALMAVSDSGPAVTLAGYECLAVVKILGIKERVMGRGDAEITIDQENWEEMTDPEKIALIDHELYHLQATKDELDGWKRDSADRPKLSMRRHTIQVGWFDEIVKRHGEASPERKQARKIVEKHRDTFFAFLDEVSPPLAGLA